MTVGTGSIAATLHKQVPVPSVDAGSILSRRGSLTRRDGFSFCDDPRPAFRWSSRCTPAANNSPYNYGEGSGESRLCSTETRWRPVWTPCMEKSMDDARRGGILADHRFSPPQQQRATRDRSSRKMHVGIEIARFWGRFVSWNAMCVNRKDPSLTLLCLRLLPRAKALAPLWSHFTTTWQRGRGRGRADYVPGFGGGGAAGFRLKSKQSDMSSALASL
jgi:hypothetical protein